MPKEEIDEGVEVEQHSDPAELTTNPPMAPVTAATLMPKCRTAVVTGRWAS
ncbi:MULTISPECIES: hypothetical protein [unclassified Streptomyces]|uniref:hypothetical protein n=1 Tax=unclassified Streptomyces TaxID=2593676 RepID=UPI0033B1C278